MRPRLYISHRMPQEKESGGDEKEKFCLEAMTHLDHLYRVALYMAKEPNDAKDLVQETYSRALSSYRQFTPGTNMKGWLTTILVNFFFHDRKRKKKWLSVEDGCGQDREAIDYWERVASENPSPETELLSKELKGKITDVLRKLPEEFRLPVILVIMGEFSYEEAAEILSCPVGTIRSRLFRGRKLMYSHLQEYMGVKEKV